MKTPGEETDMFRDGHSTLEDTIPQSMIERPQWVLWKYTPSGDKQKKLPLQPDGSPAKSNDSSTWSDFETVSAAVQNFEGVGFVFANDDPFFGIDLDACRDPGSGELVDWAADIVETFDTYTEVSPSQFGVKLIGVGQLNSTRHVKKLNDVPTFGDKKPEIAVYDDKRFWTMTGDLLDGSPKQPTDCQAAIESLCSRLWSKPAKPSKDGNANGDASCP
jgi:putative DNA primase/helicase